jgi:tetratricopeptide (TPR) repeat protein
LALSIAAVYGPSVDVPFIFDDSGAIEKNASITSVWPLLGTTEHPGPLNPPRDNAVSGRPLVNLTFAINHAFGGLNPIGYHVVSVVIHFCSALLLWAIIGRTLVLPYFSGRFETSAGWIGLVAALLWALHPLQTEAVIYASQRTELMVALFYLATLYCSLRYWTAFPLPSGEARGERALKTQQQKNHRTLWLTLAVLACLAGMASKEVMVSAPVVVLLFQRTFVAGSLRDALRNSWPLYTGLAATWLLLLALNIGAPRSGSAGFHLNVAATHYWLTQAKVFLMYLWLIVHPWPLLIHYELPYLKTFGEAWMYVLPVLLLGIGTLVLTWRNRAIGFCGATVFAILAATSVVPITTEMAAERRMYLPLAAIVAPLVVAAYLVAKRFLPNRVDLPSNRFGLERPLVAVAAPAVVLIVLCGVASAKRAYTFHDPLAVWDELATHQPNNWTAHGNKAFLLHEAGNDAAAVDEYREAVRLAPDDVLLQMDLSTLLLARGEFSEAVDHLQQVVRLKPRDLRMRNNLAAALYHLHRYDEAIAQFQATLELDPDNWVTRNNLGSAYQDAGKYREAIEAFRTAQKLNPRAFSLYLDIADCYARAGQKEKATATLREGLERARAAGDSATAEKLAGRLKESQ